MTDVIEDKKKLMNFKDDEISFNDDGTVTIANKDFIDTVRRENIIAAKAAIDVPINYKCNICSAS